MDSLLPGRLLFVNILLFEKTIAELKPLLVGARVAKIHQPIADTLVLRLWTGEENLRLLISVGSLARIHLTEKTYPNPYTPPRFCQLLRARLRRIDALSRVGGDRIAFLDVTGPDGSLRLYIELFGSPGNLLLVDGDGIIIDALVRKKSDRNGRCLQPGERYRLPEPPDRVPARSLPEALGSLESVSGRALWLRLDEYFYPLQFQAGQLGDRGELQRAVARERKRLTKRLANIAREEADKNSFAERRRLGELLLANLHRVRKGMDSVRVIDYSDDPPVEVEIDLDPRLSPQENAQALFRRYKKEKRGIDHVRRRREETEQQRAWLEQVQLALDEAVVPDDLREIAEELRQAGLYRPARHEPATRRRLSGVPTLRRVVSPGGYPILWGRNNRANDYLTTRVAAAHDYWFHALGVPGCHLLLKRDSPQVEVADDDLRHAARIAAGYSRAKGEGKVEVICCLAADVCKVKGAHPGQVRLRRFETLTVQPLRLDPE
ncbi:hypothetical protein C2E25_09650 [Geothermobacter hydrogeniphilus]|uniref:NFACT RNA-binding domain-containing protein n=1 Tax=Geothermobacter hydrogeniphilus TaxID=1969733 RepID=A0A2K2H9V3_9BACT|nr:hypothetical protein C2E25_09650 [Geothermobacter hydrogeniphilus]